MFPIEEASTHSRHRALGREVLGCTKARQSWRFQKIRGPCFGSPHSKDSDILGPIFGSSHARKLPFSVGV